MAVDQCYSVVAILDAYVEDSELALRVRLTTRPSCVGRIHVSSVPWQSLLPILHLVHRLKVSRLASQGLIKPAARRLSEILAERGPLRGPVTDAGSRAVREQRGDRG